jgi:RimJ/RimL family protein N-acetyltransferase
LERYHLITERLDLRPITTADADRLAVLHAEARVMNLLQHGVLTRAQSDVMVEHYEAESPALGFGSRTAN